MSLPKLKRIKLHTYVNARNRVARYGLGHCTRTTRFRILKVEFIVTAFKLSQAEQEYL